MVTYHYNVNIVKEMVANDRLLKFRLFLLVSKEEVPEEKAYFSIYENEISGDIFRQDKYMRLLRKKLA